ncbi:hypothetical protein C6502_17995 [Candidatus Poribacteria bacterium]|nr:MAG: hypothetical protein C6502_17995 [Candidatus Poribacteria bacterium]
MKQNKLPQNWDEKRVQQVITHYKKQTEDEATDEDEAAFGDATSQTVIQIPQELLPIVRKLLAEHLG